MTGGSHYVMDLTALGRGQDFERAYDEAAAT
jgi:hypothetical protein